MKTIEQLYQDFEKLLDLIGIPKEPPKGSFYDLTTDKENNVNEPPKRKRGGQPGNQNARKHGYYSKHFSPEQMKQLEVIDYHKGLDPEIKLLRVKINSLLTDPEADPEHLIKYLRVLGRLLAIQRRYIYG